MLAYIRSRVKHVQFGGSVQYSFFLKHVDTVIVKQIVSSHNLSAFEVPIKGC